MHRYHVDDEPGYDSAVYYDIHPTVADYLAGLHPCTDDDCSRGHIHLITIDDLVAALQHDASV